MILQHAMAVVFNCVDFVVAHKLFLLYAIHSSFLAAYHGYNVKESLPVFVDIVNRCVMT